MVRRVWARDLREAGKGRLGSLRQLVCNPWAETRFFSREGLASGRPGSDDLSASCQAPWGLSPARWDNLSVIRASAECSVSSGRIREISLTAHWKQGQD